LFAELFAKVQVHSHGKFIEQIEKRETGRPLITISNHVSMVDDPLFFGSILPMKHFANPHSPHFRWTLGAREVCFGQRAHSLFFRLGKTLPIVRGAGIYQQSMNQMLDELNRGDWLHIYPEGKINMTKEWLRLKWGVARLVADAHVTPVVLPAWHFGINFKLYEF
jgi:monolysocardiolipin acyltransferase